MKFKNILSVLVLITATLFNNNLNAACNNNDGEKIILEVKGNQKYYVIGEPATVLFEAIDTSGRQIGSQDKNVNTNTGGQDKNLSWVFAGGNGDCEIEFEYNVINKPSLVLHVEAPIDLDNNGLVDDYNSDNTGHVFWQMFVNDKFYYDTLSQTEKSCIYQQIGFGPVGTLTLGHGTAEMQVPDEHNSDISKGYFINYFNQWDAGLKRCVELINSPGNYSANTRNCVDIAYEVMQLCGITPPNADDKWYGIPLKTPQKAYNSIYAEKNNN